jgi:hypothetical protein
MREEKTEVSAYSGYRGEESPKTFIRQGKNITVVDRHVPRKPRPSGRG